MKRDSKRAYRDKMRRLIMCIIFSGALFVQGMTVSAQNVTPAAGVATEQNIDQNAEQSTELGTDQITGEGTGEAIDGSADESETDGQTENQTEEAVDFTYYEAVVVSDVNVRENAGPNYDNVIHNGKKVALSKGQEVLILSETTVGTTTWYEVRFTMDGEEMTGFSSGNFIEKTGGVITPTPLPTPIPTATPLPTATPTPEVTVVPEETGEEEVPDATPEEETGSGINKKVIFLVLAGIGSVAVIVGCYMWYQKNNDDFKPEKKKRPVPSYKPDKASKSDKSSDAAKEEEQKAEQSGKDKSVKESVSNVSSASSAEKMKNSKKEVNAAKAAKQETQVKTEAPADSVKTVKGPGIAVMKRERTSTVLSEREVKPISKPQEDTPKEESKPQNETYEREWAESLRKRDTRPQFDEKDFIREYEKQTEDKQELRRMVDELKEHDVVIHRFFGYGEVDDNSDIKLIEIRFGSDVRYFNKDSLVAKKMFAIPKKENK